MKAVNHSQPTRDVVSGNTARSQKTNQAGTKKDPRLKVIQAHQNTPSGLSRQNLVPATALNQQESWHLHKMLDIILDENQVPKTDNPSDSSLY